MFVERATLKRIGEEISTHVVSLTISDHNVAKVDLILDEEVPKVEMFRPLRARLPSILRQENATLIVLMEYIFHNEETLSLQEIFRPQDVWQYIMDPDEFTLS
jgi:hypothetical protein